MAVNKDAYTNLVNELQNKNVMLVAVSKTKPVEDILALYRLGQRDFGENYVQELLEKQSLLPADIRWHFIGHLQSNKVRYVTSLIHLIHGVDSYNLLKEIDKYAAKNKRIVNCLLQVHIAEEETKFGFNEQELDAIISQLANTGMDNVKAVGLMGMASLTEDMQKIRAEFKYLKSIFDKYQQPQTTNFNFQILSMGMSSDYIIALEEGSNMVRIGSLLFGNRDYKNDKG